MNIKKTWRASSKKEELEKSDDLANLEGQWGVGVDILTIQPYVYYQGPVEVKTTIGDPSQEKPPK